MKVSESFYKRADVVKIARDLIGKRLVTLINGTLTGGIIVETEAYSWKERGCHAFGKKKTDRNAVMFEDGGKAYVYLCYGMHHLFNVVTNVNGIPEAVLIRAIEPEIGREEMIFRRGERTREFHLTSGPGKLTKALGIDRKLNGKSLLDYEVWIENSGKKIRSADLEVGPRIGIDYAGIDANLPWRFFLRGNPWISR
jgi:DNA-3-methyladenine glycosylase